ADRDSCDRPAPLDVRLCRFRAQFRRRRQIGGMAGQGLGRGGDRGRRRRADRRGIGPVREPERRPSPLRRSGGFGAPQGARAAEPGGESRRADRPRLSVGGWRAEAARGDARRIRLRPGRARGASVPQPRPTGDAECAGRGVGRRRRVRRRLGGPIARRRRQEARRAAQRGQAAAEPQAETARLSLAGRARHLDPAGAAVMTPEPHPLYDLLPVIVRMRDADAGYPLRALVTLIGEQVDAVEADIDRQYANWFIETCDDWVVPYIGDLVGYRPVAATGRARSGDGAEAHMLNAAITPRAEIANILAFRRRKGTLALLEDLAFSVADWPARAVEFYTLLARTQHVNHFRPGRGRSVDVRDGDALARLGGPFERIAHNVDVRRAGGGRRHGRFNIPSIGVFAWRLGTFPVSHAPACCVEGEGSECYTFSILGNDQQLYSGPVAE